MPDWFTDPFRYAPHPLVKTAAAEVISMIENGQNLSEVFSEGKMLGVLVCERNGDSAPCFIAAFSGTVSGTATIEGFVPPIFDLTVSDGYFRQEEARISDLNRTIRELESSGEHSELKAKLSALRQEQEKELEAVRQAMQGAKARRSELRKQTLDTETLEALTKESQFEKAELRRLKISWNERIASIESEIQAIASEIKALKKQRAEMSDALQDWIFHQYIVHNALGEELSIAEIFSADGLTPPGGTGECAAPKLLEYAFRNGLRPVAMGEFWYGKASETAVRVHGHFYPSCTSKCGPLLGYMLQGLSLAPKEVCTESPVILHEDDEIIIAVKPSGMPSVPGLDGRISLEEWLRDGREVFAVHRLDMDTSGVMLFAKTASSAVDLQRQFEVHSVRKTYCARITASPGTAPELRAAKVHRTVCSSLATPAARGVARFFQPLYQEMQKNGIIDLPITADYDERPRQKVDFAQGKPATTEYEIIQTNPDGTADILFHPITGRTHQLRVHSAHTLGLGSPILGDMLYGGQCTAFQDSTEPSPKRLHLHARSLSFTHPTTGEALTFSSDIHKY